MRALDRPIEATDTAVIRATEVGRAKARSVLVACASEPLVANLPEQVEIFLVDHATGLLQDLLNSWLGPNHQAEEP